ncbi:putative EMP1-like protein, partial [Plasmodium gaboni]
WECDNSKFQSGHQGACMPPRRQKLCIKKLTKLNGNDTTKLRETLIKCAAVETFFAWQYYKKTSGQSGNVETQLQSGTIPEDFKRQMFYTLGDFRDLILDTDISAKRKNPNGKTDVGKAVENIKKILDKKDGQAGGTQTTP